MNDARAPRVLVLAMDPRLMMDPKPHVKRSRHQARIIGLAGYFVEEERAEVDLVTADSGGWERLDERVRLHRLDKAEARHPLPWLERTIVVRVPRLLVRPVARLGRLGAALEKARNRGSQAVHRRVFVPFYRHVRPLLLSRIGWRRALRDVDMTQVARVVVMDRTSVPLGRRLARRHPDLIVTTRQDRSLHSNP
ncbi:hypothetical protein D0T12_05360 [Actinomadura spongiicola]|uniref:Glycosyltransferase n=1 Tax=Actinomadura spongiicola TaxID=2303421 RepID=A0A372GLT6_9ACTN|nr:hypothetical protein [Actinomadura spongiicola]RFS86059.1 hypothetical protein D0T12_05360 [Actinomadura spongiicola]